MSISSNDSLSPFFFPKVRLFAYVRLFCLRRRTLAAEQNVLKYWFWFSDTIESFCRLRYCRYYRLVFLSIGIGLNFGIPHRCARELHRKCLGNALKLSGFCMGNGGRTTQKQTINCAETENAREMCYFLLHAVFIIEKHFSLLSSVAKPTFYLPFAENKFVPFLGDTTFLSFCLKSFSSRFLPFCCKN